MCCIGYMLVGHRALYWNGILFVVGMELSITATCHGDRVTRRGEEVGEAVFERPPNPRERWSFLLQRRLNDTCATSILLN